MRRLIFGAVFLIMLNLPSITVADRLYLPLVSHYGANNYFMLLITNFSAMGTDISIQFTGSGQENPSTSQPANTFSSSITKNRVMAANETWLITSTEGDLFGTTTTDMQRATVSIQSSGTDVPNIGPIGVGAFFIHLNSRQSPVGFIYPATYRTISWIGPPTGLSPGTATVLNWKQ